MSAAATGRLVILSGPSCVGKSPLKRALARFHPRVWSRLTKLVLYDSRAPGEIDGEDYHFGRGIRSTRCGYTLAMPSLTSAEICRR